MLCQVHRKTHRRLTRQCDVPRWPRAERRHPVDEEAGAGDASPTHDGYSDPYPHSQEVTPFRMRSETINRLGADRPSADVGPLIVLG
jgi:hypothetical protein